MKDKVEGRTFLLDSVRRSKDDFLTYTEKLRILQNEHKLTNKTIAAIAELFLTPEMFHEEGESEYCMALRNMLKGNPHQDIIKDNAKNIDHMRGHGKKST